MNRSPFFSVIIVTYNSGKWINECLRALRAQSLQTFEIILVDNASSDSTLHKVRNRRSPAMIIVENDTNVGFAAACNQGAKLANTPWVVFLNPDTMATENWLSEVRSGIKRHPSAKMFACTQIKLDTPNTLDGTGDVYSVFGVAWRGAEGHPRSSLPSEGECFSPCGAAAVFSRTTYEALTGFDESLFCYCEDIDLGFRMRLANETCIYLPKAQVYHKGGGSSSEEDQSFSLYHGFRNRFWVSVKNQRLRFLVFSLPALVLLTLVQAFSARKAKKGYSRVILSALYDAITGCAPYWKMRSTIDQSTHWQNARQMMCGSLTKLRHRSPHIKAVSMAD